jgi:PAS domain S-box-containing protein
MAQIGLDGTFLRVSATLCAMIGYTREELLACKIQDVIHPDDLEADVTQMKVLLTGELTTCVLEERLLCKEGGVVWVYLTRSLLRDPDGKPYRFICVIDNITLRKRIDSGAYG